MKVEGVRKMLVAQFKGGTAKDWAKEKGLSAAYVSDVLKGRRDPGDKILKALGLVRSVDYHKG